MVRTVHLPSCVMARTMCHSIVGDQINTPSPPATVGYGRVAQLVEHWTENPSVGGSNPPPTTFSF